MERLRVFISARSADYQHAQRVYRHLQEARIPAFFSQESLPELGNTAYLEEIDRALAEVDHMIVVTTSVENVLSPWVAAEWRFFINEQRSGRKRGNLLTIVVGGLEFAELPPSLRQYECLRLEGSALETVLRYLSGERRRPEEMPSPQRRRGFRSVATFGGKTRVNALAVRSSEPSIATGGFDGAVRFYSAEDQTHRWTLTSTRYQLAGVEALITALAFSPDGRRVASGQIDGVVHVWDVDDDRELPASIAHQGAVSALTFLEDGKTLLSASRPGEIKISNVEVLRSGTEALPRMAAPVLAAALHGKQPWLVTGLADLPARRFGFQFLEATGSYRLLCFAKVSDSFSCLALARDGRWLAAGGTDGAARLYDLAPVEEAIGARRGEIPLNPLPLGGGGIRPPHRKPVKSIAMLGDGRGYLTTALDNQIVLWDLETRKPAVQVQGEPDESFAGALLLGDGRLVSALSDGRLRLWEAT